MTDSLHLEVIRADEMPATVREQVVSLCSRAFEEDFDLLLGTFPGAVHLMARLGSALVSHALWVTRWLQAGTAPPMRTAYVEAVATEKQFRHRGYASAVMKRLAGEIQDFELGALSPSDHRFYERFGWQLWRGPLFIRKGEELLATPEDEEVMVLRLPMTPPLDLDAPLSAEWREGELW
jgi:aminoglycoside 2'-N-acetyltransferase I